jgi:hypothetical protein
LLLLLLFFVVTPRVKHALAAPTEQQEQENC